MRTYPDCIPCFMRQTLDALRFTEAPDDVVARSFKRVLREASDFEMTLSPPEMAAIIHRIIRDESGHDDPYETIKKMSSKEALQVEERIRSIINGSDTPLETAIRFAIAGNVMDFALYQWDMDRFNRQLEQALEKPINSEQIQSLTDAAAAAKSVLILADNAGESLFDKLLLEQLPCERKIYAVKGSPVINDCTEKDARDVGIHNVAEIISNGTDIPGTVLRACDPAFLKEFEQADLVISKGQGNCESLLDNCPRPVFFLTQIKCKVLARDLDGSVGDWVITSG